MIEQVPQFAPYLCFEPQGTGGAPMCQMTSEPAEDADIMVEYSGKSSVQDPDLAFLRSAPPPQSVPPTSAAHQTTTEAGLPAEATSYNQIAAQLLRNVPGLLSRGGYVAPWTVTASRCSSPSFRVMFSRRRSRPA